MTHSPSLRLISALLITLLIVAATLTVFPDQATPVQPGSAGEGSVVGMAPDATRTGSTKLP